MTPPSDTTPTRRAMVPGEVSGPDDVLVLNVGRASVSVLVMNTGDRPIQVGSHYHFFETNPALCFDRAATRGFRLDIVAGTSVRFEPGIEQTVALVAYGGARIAAGFRGEVSGPIDG
jgi:urease subunit beta